MVVHWQLYQSIQHISMESNIPKTSIYTHTLQKLNFKKIGTHCKATSVAQEARASVTSASISSVRSQPKL